MDKLINYRLGYKEQELLNKLMIILKILESINLYNKI